MGCLRRASVALIAAAALASHSEALSSISSPVATSSSVFATLQSTPLTRASDSEIHAAALKEQVLPAIPRQKLYFVGVGTSQAAAEFAQQLGVDPALCFGDEGGVAGEALGLEKGFKTMWNPPAVDNMMARNDEQSLKKLGEAYKTAADNIGIQNLAPKDVKDTLRQGGTFIFKGNLPLLEHYDGKVGDNCKIEDILASLN